MNVSVVEYFSDKHGNGCGYCKGKKSSLSSGMWAHMLTVEDYQDLIDRGWRRSGRYCYKPTLDKTCCPQYTIRADALSFKPSKSHKKVIKRFRNYIINGAPPGKEEVFTPPPRTFDLYEDENEDSEDETMEVKANQVASKLQMTSKMEIDQQTSSSQNGGSSPSSPISRSSSTLPSKLPKPGMGPDPMKPKCKKAKEIRKEKALQKLAEKGIAVPPKPNSTSEKSLEDLLLAPFPPESKHKFEIRIYSAQTADEDFMKTFNESLQVYRKYQVSVHKDAPQKCSPDQFKRFLCNSSLILVDEPFIEESTNEELAPGYGAFHQQYLIDGKIICVGIIDILPRCLSSVYLYYDPDYSFLSLGTLSSLFEMTFVKRLAKIKPELKSYYMGFYIHSCPKMRYKAQYLPSDIACPETLEWVPVEQCLPLLDKSKYSRLSHESVPGIPDVDVNKVGILYRRQRLEFGLYRQLQSENHVKEDALEKEEQEVLDYARLIGDDVSQRMLLFRTP